MPKILINEKNIYYEIHGEGEPLLILNGIMMSTSSWTSFVDVFSKKYKLILVDFVDQGQSDKMEDLYSQDIHVEMLNEFLVKLNVGKVNLVGISYGGEIAQKFALKYENHINSLVLANTTSYTTNILKDIGENWIQAAKTYDGIAFFKATMPYVYSGEFYEKNIDWLKEREKSFAQSLKPEWYESFIRLVKSAEDLKITDEIAKIKLPTMIIGAEYDTTTPLRYQEEIHKKIANSKFAVISGSGHATMYEKPHEFVSLIIGFIESHKSEIKIV